MLRRFRSSSNSASSNATTPCFAPRCAHPTTPPALRASVKRVHTLQAGAALHSVRFLPVTQPADVEAERLNVINPLCHHQVLVHQEAAVRAGLAAERETSWG